MQRGAQKPLDDRHRDLKRVAGMVLDPLAEVEVGVLVAVVVRRREYVVDFERNRKGRQRRENQHQSDSNRGAANLAGGYVCMMTDHSRRCFTRGPCAVSTGTTGPAATFLTQAEAPYVTMTPFIASIMTLSERSLC